MNTALITGAGRGIGLATAKAFLKAGWKVLALDKDFSRCDEKNFARVDFDLTNVNQIKKLIDSLGEIHTLVNNAGVLYCDDYESIERKSWRSTSRPRPSSLPRSRRNGRPGSRDGS